VSSRPLLFSFCEKKGNLWLLMCAVISFRSCSGRAAQDHIPGTDLLSLCALFYFLFLRLDFVLASFFEAEFWLVLVCTPFVCSHFAGFGWRGAHQIFLFFSFPGRGSVFFAVKSVTSANCAELSEFLLPRPELNLFLANLRSLILTFQLNFRHALISLSVSSHNGCSDISYYSIPQFGLISGPSFFCQLLHFLK
jgi:hypothetical protein